MMIPPFAMPTDERSVIKFRVPTVQMCIDYAELTEQMEQEIATGYLDKLNLNYSDEDEFSSSAYWTAQDRKAALFWLYIHVTENTEQAVSYNCGCGERHKVLFDMQDLAEFVTTGILDAPQNNSIESDNLEYRITPLFGWGEQHLEVMRLAIDEEPTAKQKADIKVMRVLLQVLPVELIGKPSTEVIDRLTELKSKLSIPDFKRIANVLHLYNERNTFGLQSQTDELGEIKLLTPKFECESESKGGGLTRLTIPFRRDYYLPAL